MKGIEKTKTWMISSKKVVTMLQEIDKQKRLQEKILASNGKVELRRCGRNSIVAQGYDSCFSWAEEILKIIDIRIKKIKIGPPEFLFKYPRSYTDTLEKQQEKHFIIQI